jgi:hypothetical protein
MNHRSDVATAAEKRAAKSLMGLLKTRKRAVQPKGKERVLLKKLNVATRKANADAVGRKERKKYKNQVTRLRKQLHDISPARKKLYEEKVARARAKLARAKLNAKKTKQRAKNAKKREANRKKAAKKRLQIERRKRIAAKKRELKHKRAALKKKAAEKGRVRRAHGKLQSMAESGTSLRVPRARATQGNQPEEAQPL